MGLPNVLIRPCVFLSLNARIDSNVLFALYVVISSAEMFLFLAYRFSALLKELKAAWKAGGAEACKRLIEKHLDEWKGVPLNVAVIGGSGVGKSAFINAIRHLTADDKGAAKVGVTETTLNIRSFKHPNNPMLKFWDLPGVGTDKFPKATYLADIKVDRYDFFLLITADRFMENDTWLCNELHNRQKNFFFVRTKIDVDISNHKISHPSTHDEKAVINEIRKSTAKHLKANGFGDVPMFLIDNHELQKFQFKELEQQLINDFPDPKKLPLKLSLDATSKEAVQDKVEQL